MLVIYPSVAKMKEVAGGSNLVGFSLLERRLYFYAKNAPELVIDDDEIIKTLLPDDRWVTNRAVPLQQFIQGDLKLKGTWDAAANSPALASGVGEEGGYYIVGTPGATSLDGENDWASKDWAIFSGGAWRKIDNSETGGESPQALNLQNCIAIGYTKATTGGGAPTMSVTNPKRGEWYLNIPDGKLWVFTGSSWSGPIDAVDFAAIIFAADGAGSVSGAINKTKDNLVRRWNTGSLSFDTIPKAAGDRYFAAVEDFVIQQGFTDGIDYYVSGGLMVAEDGVTWKFLGSKNSHGLYVDKIGSRAINTSYIPNKFRGTEVIASLQLTIVNADNVGFNVLVDGVAIADGNLESENVAGGTVRTIVPVTFFVPPNSSYNLSCSSGVVLIKIFEKTKEIG